MEFNYKDIITNPEAETIGELFGVPEEKGMEACDAMMEVYKQNKLLSSVTDVSLGSLIQDMVEAANPQSISEAVLFTCMATDMIGNAIAPVTGMEGGIVSMDFDDLPQELKDKLTGFIGDLDDEE